MRCGDVVAPNGPDFEAYLLGKDHSKPHEVKDEFFRYSRATPKGVSTLKVFNPIEWWSDNKLISLERNALKLLLRRVSV
jgi:hypothetical protein